MAVIGERPAIVGWGGAVTLPLFCKQSKLSYMNNLAAFEIEKEIRGVKLPKATSTYTPIPHGTIIDEVRAYAANSGLNILRETLSSGSKGRQFAGTWVMGNGDPEFGYSIGTLNSYDKSRRFKLAKGAAVLVCLNGMVRAEGLDPVFSRLHTGDAVEVMKEQIRKGPSHTEKEFLISQAELMKGITLNPREMSELAGRMFVDEQILTTPELSKLKDIIRYIGGQRKSAPAGFYDYGGDNTVWNLYNHTTAVLKDAHPTRSIQAHNDLHRMFEDEFDLVGVLA